MIVYRRYDVFDIWDQRGRRADRRCRGVDSSRRGCVRMLREASRDLPLIGARGAPPHGMPAV